MSNKPKNRAEPCVARPPSTLETLNMAYAEVVRLRKEILKAEIASQNPQVLGLRSKKTSKVD
ncbi:hypothetical protein L6654_37735 [Bradyrhizobium sp. WYCCWR 13023]|uniref:Uncharacterized protein n=1 Tax=Bradyrhizobium zhengyangense TaxID=2911009 RepID=A0A9X1RGQ6_9BRAD|nr:hypothetical protein [Bradyrhizobium zhengyangense]MCG2632359.1 hypothetical protein [Bradyrhizobium zhengyangense]